MSKDDSGIQMSLFDSDDLLPLQKYDRRGGLLASFEAFHHANPHVYRIVKAMALYAQSRGKRVGIGNIWERLRWEYGVETDGDEYRLNNNHRAFMARLVMDTVPELEGFFDTREQRNNYEWETIDLDALRAL